MPKQQPYAQLQQRAADISQSKQCKHLLTKYCVSEAEVCCSKIKMQWHYKYVKVSHKYMWVQQSAVYMCSLL